MINSDRNKTKKILIMVYISSICFFLVLGLFFGGICNVIAGPVKTIYGTVEGVDSGNVDGAMVVVSTSDFVNETTMVSGGTWQVDIGPLKGTEWPDGTFFSVLIVLNDASVETTGVVNGSYTNAGHCILNSSSLTVRITVDSPSAAVGEPIGFSALVTGGFPPYTYSWDLNNDGNYDDAQEKNTSYSFHSAGSKTVYLRIADDTGSVVTDSILLTIIAESSSGGEKINLPAENHDPVTQVWVSLSSTLVNTPVLFNASDSFDEDGDTLNFTWDFDDGTHSFQPIVHHSFEKAGSYLISLTVSDGQGGEDKVTTEIIIQRSFNYHPEKPIVIGPQHSSINQSASFIVTSLDKDNDSIRYIIDWDDNTTTITDYMPSNTSSTMTHQWTVAGVYTIDISAEDNKNSSSMNTCLLVFIDVNVIFINGSINGYLLDNNQDGVFDLFYNNATQDENKVKKQDDGYLIDITKDGTWDHLFNITEGLQSFVENDEKRSQDSPTISVIIFIAFILTFFILKRK